MLCWLLLVFQTCFQTLVWFGSVTPLLSLTSLWTRSYSCLMEIWGNFQRYKYQYLSYTDEMEEPVLDRKEFIGNHPGEGSALSFMLWQAWRWDWVAIIIITIITKVQSAILNLGFSDHDFTLHLKQRGVGLEYPMKQQFRREAFIGRLCEKPNDYWNTKMQLHDRLVIVLCRTS